MTLVVVILFEGLSMGVLMVFHCMNFKHGGLLKSGEDAEEQPYASIKPGELHYFTDTEIEAAYKADEEINYLI